MTILKTENLKKDNAEKNKSGKRTNPKREIRNRANQTNDRSGQEQFET